VTRDEITDATSDENAATDLYNLRNDIVPQIVRSGADSSSIVAQ